MYVILLNHPNLPALHDLLPELKLSYPCESFSINGSEDRGYSIQINGIGDERGPRNFAYSFLKKWKPKVIQPL